MTGWLGDERQILDFWRFDTKGCVHDVTNFPVFVDEKFLVKMRQAAQCSHY